jgi:hypothetical protein
MVTVGKTSELMFFFIQVRGRRYYGALERASVSLYYSAG